MVNSWYGLPDYSFKYSELAFTIKSFFKLKRFIQKTPERPWLNYFNYFINKLRKIFFQKKITCPKS